MKKQSRKQWKKSKYITGMALLLAALEMLMIFVGNHLQTVSNQNLQEAYKNQIKYKTLAMELKECSDFLTNEVSAFASTGQILMEVIPLPRSSAMASKRELWSAL